MSNTQFWSARDVKAVRKRRQCQHCLQYLEVGQPATVVSGVWDGDFFCNSMHPFCEKAAQDTDTECGGETVWLHELDAEQLMELQADHWIAVGMVKRSYVQTKQRRDQEHAAQ